jgi:phosphohistidine swiveling domain-containing protein
VSAGAAQGKARVIRPGDPWMLSPGEVLVAPVLDAAFGPLLASAAGAVAEVGGMLSHGAVVARELGVPCVVEVKDATRRIRTGDVVVVDGGTGEVGLPGEEGAPAVRVPSPVITPEEGGEALHLLEDHPLARESVYFNPQDSASGIGVVSSLGVKAGGRGEAVAVLTLPDGRVLFAFARGKPVADHRGFAVGGLRAEWPPVRLHVEAPMAEFEAAGFPSSPQAMLLAPRTARVVIDLRFEPACPAVDFCPGLPERSRAALRPLGDHHLEQSGRWRGEIRVDDRVFPFDGFGHRDHSWGLRDWNALDHSRLFAVSLGDDLAVHALTLVAAGQPVEGGFVWRDGRAERVTRILYAPKRDGSRLASFDLRVITAAGEPVTLRGTPWRTVDVPVQLERRLFRHLAGRPYGLVLHESFTRYEGEGRRGYGIAEFSERPRTDHPS